MAGLYNSKRNLTGVGSALSAQPSKSPSGFQNFISGLGNFFTSDMAPVALGMGAQAAMGKHQNTWQAGLGRAAVELQRSKIAAKAATRQAEERRALIRLLSGQGVTPVDKAGPSKVGLTINPDKTQTIKIDGNKMVDGIFGGKQIDEVQNIDEVGSKGVPRPVTAPAATTQTRAPSGPGTNTLPFYLAQAVGSSGGTGESLAGLTPEQIGGIARRDMLGGELGNRSVSDIFTNMQKQAYSDYTAGRLPIEQQKAASAALIAQRKLILEARRDAAMNAKDYATVNKINKEISMIDPEFALKTETQGALTSQRRAETGRVNQQVGARELLMESGMGPGDTNVGALLAAGGSAGSITGAKKQEFDQANEIAAIKSKLLIDNASDSGASADAQRVNATIPGTTNSFVHWHRGALNDQWKEFNLPIVNGRQMSMQDARDEAALRGVSLEVFLKDVYAHLKARNELTESNYD